MLQKEGTRGLLVIARIVTKRCVGQLGVEQGGETIPTNLLTLCSMCHETIHPWIEGKEYVAA